jgi:hypothetical protein
MNPIYLAPQMVGLAHHLRAVGLPPQTRARYERNALNYLAFFGPAAALCCYERLVRLTA